MTSKYQYLVITYLLIIVSSSCSSTKKIDALKPEPDEASPLVYDNVASFINLPIKLKLRDVENQINKTLTGLIYEDNTIEDDDYEVKIWKLAPITLENENGRIRTVLPLKAFVKYRIGTSKLGISLYNVKEFNFNGTVTLSSNVGLTNWKLHTNTELKSLDWNESPSVTVLGKSIPITYLINPTVRLLNRKSKKPSMML